MASLDILVIVDDSAAAAPYLDTFSAGFGRMAEVLERSEGGLPSIHVAFIPATVATDSCTAQESRASACGLAPSDSFVTVDGCGGDPNFSKPLHSTFECLASLGSAGCGAPTPLAALRRALGGDGGEGQLSGATPFLRPDAYLGVVIAMSGDDSSARNGTAVPVQEYVDFVRGLKSDPVHTELATVIAPGPIESSPRLGEFARAFAGNGLIYPLAAGQDFGPAYQTFVEYLPIGPAPSCAAGVRDMDPDLPGLQPDCTATDTSTFVDGTTVRTVHASLPSCDVSGPPCWRFSANSNVGSCPAGDWVWSVDRGGNWCSRFAANAVLTCRGCADSTDPACAGP